MASPISRIAVELAMKADKFNKGMKGARAEVQETERRLGGLGRALQRVGEIATGFIVANVIQRGFAEIKSFVTGSISLFSDLQESVSKTEAVFGDNSQAVIDWSNKSAQAVGMNKAAALEATSTVGNLLKGVGISNDLLPEYSMNLIQTAADLGSFNNVDPSQVVDDLRSGLVGQAEPLRKYGILISEAAVKTKAMELGLVGANGELTEAAKVQARYALIMEQVGDAQGDFAKTSGGMANGLRILRAHFQNLQIWLGSKIQPTIARFIKNINLVVARIQELIGGGMNPLQAVLQAVRERIEAVFGRRAAARFTSAVNIVAKVIDFLVRAFWLVVDAARMVLRFLGFLLDHLDTLKPVIAGLVTAFILLEVVVPIIMSVVTAAKVLRVALWSINPWFLIIAAAVALFYVAWTKNWFGIRDKTQAVIDWLQENVFPVIKALIDYWNDVVHNRIQPGNLESIPKWLRPIAFVIGRVIKTLRVFVKTWQDKGFVAALKIIPTQLRAFGRAVAGFLTQITGLKSVGDLVKRQFNLLADTIRNVIELVDNIIHGRWGAAFDNLKNIALNGVKFVVNGVVGAFRILGEILGQIEWLQVAVTIFTKLWEGLKWAWDNIVIPGLQAFPQLLFDTLAVGWDLIYSLGNFLLGALWEGVKFAWDWGIGWVKDLPGRIVDWWNGFYNWFHGVGNYLISGLWAGISAAWNWMIGKLQAAWSALPDWARKLWGVMSPSRVFADIGEQLNRGLVKGVMDTLPMVERAMGELANTTPGLSVGVSGGAALTPPGVLAAGGTGGPNMFSFAAGSIIVNNPANGETVAQEILAAVQRKKASKL